MCLGLLQVSVGDGEAAATAAAPSLPNSHNTLQVRYATLIESH